MIAAILVVTLAVIIVIVLCKQVFTGSQSGCGAFKLRLYSIGPHKRSIDPHVGLHVVLWAPLRTR